ncbi:GNAT family N-acetyltransferase [Paenibacillus hunanensis]|uniref:Ribosomal protein S18 acetylase RimI-like enzyme n=1 Tax=Paenibacillus hunanensis TaxID=539262 RepID=A0ABU1IUT0_9BACL|nr:GNAT family N-acetyltransferase [Paenibacillus hunanensis]MDR6243032.1 ribosomal protein S18 acetylase RimI-like enzyme [Paenibacillus hunanensis]GGJ12469.1 N-acetyltransferase [Paenibacillus hunanensis]
MLKLSQLSDILELQHTCEQHDGITLKLNWDMLKHRSPGMQEDFFSYEEGKLVSFLALYGFGRKIEVCGMTHPEYRRQGHFSRLWQQAIGSEAITRMNRVLFNTPHNSIAGQQWVQSHHARLDSTEYSMKLEHGEHSLLGQFEGKEIAQLRRFREEDTDLWARLDADAFGISEFSTIAALASPSRSLTKIMLVIEHSGLAVGKIEIDRQDEHSWIYGFAVDPALRGHGIGRSALRQVALQEHARGNHVWLDVSATNPRALHLYESCGFVQQDIQDYYEYELPQT